jgi:hypothetical protein
VIPTPGQLVAIRHHTSWMGPYEVTAVADTCFTTLDPNWKKPDGDIAEVEMHLGVMDVTLKYETLVSDRPHEIVFHNLEYGKGWVFDGECQYMEQSELDRITEKLAKRSFMKDLNRSPHELPPSVKTGEAA